MKILPIFILIIVFSTIAFAQKCLETAKEVAPVLSAETRRQYTERAMAAQVLYEAHRNDADKIIWYGRRTAYLGNYKHSINIFTAGIDKFPKDARFYRHRGHRFITIRCFDDAIKDFEKAAKLVKGKADEIEPDGLPNAKNIPTSTLQSNIFYHLGLAYYLKGDFKKALKAYREGERVSTNPDMRVATIHWLYMTLRRLRKEKEAEKTIASVADNLEIIENDDYYKLIKLYQGKIKAEDLITQDANSLSSASLGYGVGNWYLYNGKKDEAMKIFREINLGNLWSSFGFIAAEAELRK